MDNIWDHVNVMPWTDYQDTIGYIYHVQEYSQAKVENKPTPCEKLYGFPGILISFYGTITGAIREPEGWSFQSSIK